MLNAEDLHHYQREAAAFVVNTPRCALWIDMGLGKTVSTLTALVYLFARFLIGRVLVIAPKRVATHVWPQEIANWEHTKHLTYSVLVGTATQRRHARTADVDIHIVNRDNVQWLVGSFNGPMNWPYDVVVIDEASSFKHSSGKRFAALYHTLIASDRVIELTGTPAPNGLHDLWAPLSLLDRGVALGRTVTDFRNRYFDKHPYSGEYTLRAGADAKIHEAIRHMVLRMDARDHLDMPERIDNELVVHLPAEAEEQYREMERRSVLQLREAADGELLSAANAAVLTGKLLQIANGAIYHDDSRDVHHVHHAKLDALGEILDSSPGQSVLVAVNYQHDRTRILERFHQAVPIEAPGAIEAWNQGRVPVLVAHPASAGHGLNLQHGGHILVWFGLTWSLELYEQMNARLHRQGQTRGVVIHHIVAAGTIDERVRDVLRGKATVQQALLDAARGAPE